MKKSVLKSYAHLIAAAGVNIQKGQEVVIQASLDQPEFIRILVEECYKCGASDVLVLWSDPSIAISNFKHKKIADLSTMKFIVIIYAIMPFRKTAILLLIIQVGLTLLLKIQQVGLIYP